MYMKHALPHLEQVTEVSPQGLASKNLELWRCLVAQSVKHSFLAPVMITGSQE